MVTNVLKRQACTNEECGTTGNLEPVIIAPTWSKAVARTPLVGVWSQAVKEIQEAAQIIVIGYSLPKTDTFFQYLLTLGLKSNPKLFRLVVVNKDDSAELKNRYKEVFARSLHDRGRLRRPRIK